MLSLCKARQFFPLLKSFQILLLSTNPLWLFYVCCVQTSPIDWGHKKYNSTNVWPSIKHLENKRLVWKCLVGQARRGTWFKHSSRLVVAAVETLAKDCSSRGQEMDGFYYSSNGFCFLNIVSWTTEWAMSMTYQSC